MKKLCYIFFLCLCLVHIAGAQTISKNLLLLNPSGNSVTLGTPASVTNNTILLPGSLGIQGALPYLSSVAGSVGTTSWLNPGAAGSVLTLSGGIPSWTNTLGVSSGGTGTATAFTPGSIVFAGAGGVFSQNNANFFWDNTNLRLGIGTNTPSQSLEVKNGNVLLSNAGTAGQLQFQGTSTGLSTLQAGAQGVTSFNYILPITTPTANQVLTATAVAGSAITFGWANNAAAGGVSYNISSQQATATPRTNYLFNVGYSAGAANATAAGALITSNAGAGASAQDATGLTVQAIVNNNGTANGAVISATNGGSQSSAVGLSVTAGGSGTGTTKGLTVAVSGGTTNYAAILTGGNVGIDTTTPNAKLSVNGETYSSTFRTTTANSKPAYAEARMFYDTALKTMAYYNDHNGITLNVGQEEWIRVFNASGASITNGSPVYINGANAGTGLPSIAPAKGDALATADAIGICTETIPNNSVGYVTAFGVVHQMNTSAYTAGQTLYVSATTAGTLTATRPNQPNFTNPIGYVAAVDAVLGKIMVMAGKTRQGSMTKGAVAFGGSDGFIREAPAQFFYDSTNFRLGIGTNAPATAIDLTGDISIRYHGITLASDSVDNLAIGSYSYVGITGRTNNYSITGIANGVDGKQVQLINLTSKAMTLYHQNTSSTSANRIYNPSGQNITIADSGTIGLVYNGLLNCWVVQSSISAMSGTSNFTIKRQKTTQSITNSTTFQLASDFNYNVKPNSIYEVEVVLLDSGVGGSNMAASPLMPAGATLTGVSVSGIDGFSGQEVSIIRNGDYTSGVPFLSMSGVSSYSISHLILTTGATGGAVDFVWGMLSSDASKTVWLFKDSYMIIRLIGKV